MIIQITSSNKHPILLTVMNFKLQKNSLSSLQTKIPTEDYSEHGKSDGQSSIRNVELDQVPSSKSPPPRKSGRPSKKKPVISIRVKLDEDLRSLKRENYKNFDKILSRCNHRSCLLIIKKSASSKHDEYYLNFVNNSHNKPYRKLLRKNRRKKETNIGRFAAGVPNKSLASEFSEENIFPVLKQNQNIFSETSYDLKYSKKELFNISSPEQPFISDIRAYGSAEGKADTKQDKTVNDIKTQSEKTEKITNNELAIPSHLIPYEEAVLEEKSLRNWPVITKLFDEKNIEIYKNYLKSLSSQNEEEEIIEENSNKDSVTLDIEEARAFHQSISGTSVKERYSAKPKSKIPNNNENTKENSSSNFKTSTIYRKSFTGSKNYFEKRNEENKYVIEKSLLPANHFIVSEKSAVPSNNSQKLFTSTAYLLIDGTGDESNKGNEPYTMNGEIGKTMKSSEPDSNVKSRLLSSSAKTYESIKRNDNSDEEESCYYCEENLADSLTENNKNNGESRKRGMKKFYFFNIVLAVFITVVLGIILFISFADNSMISGLLEKYMRR